MRFSEPSILGEYSLRHVTFPAPVCILYCIYYKTGASIEKLFWNAINLTRKVNNYLKSNCNLLNKIIFSVFTNKIKYFNYCAGWRCNKGENTESTDV